MKNNIYPCLLLICFTCIISFSCSRPQTQAEKEQEIVLWTGHTIEPKRPDGLPAEAQWMGSVDSYGSWFQIEKPKTLSKDEYLITNFNYYPGVKKEIDWAAVFKKETSGDFLLDKLYKFTFPYDYEKCAIIQDGKEFKFSFVRDWKK